MDSSSSSKLTKADLAEMMVGAMALAFPVALRRTIVVAFPAVFSASIVDSLR